MAQRLSEGFLSFIYILQLVRIRQLICLDKMLLVNCYKLYFKKIIALVLSLIRNGLTDGM